MAELSNRSWFDIFVGLTSLVCWKRMRNGLNEPREDFIGTGVGDVRSLNNGLIRPTERDIICVLAGEINERIATMR